MPAQRSFEQRQERQRQQRINEKREIVNPAVIERNAVQCLIDIDDEIVPQGQNVGQEVECRVHGFGRERKSRKGKRYDTQQRAGTQCEAQRGNDAEKEYARAL